MFDFQKRPVAGQSADSIFHARDQEAASNSPASDTSIMNRAAFDHDFSRIPIHAEKHESERPDASDVHAGADLERLAPPPALNSVDSPIPDENEETKQSAESSHGDAMSDGSEDTKPGHSGRHIIYGDFKDRINTLLARLTSRTFRKQFNEWKDSPDQYTIQRDERAIERLVDAVAIPEKHVYAPNTANEHKHFDVKYKQLRGPDEKDDDDVDRDHEGDDQERDDHEHDDGERDDQVAPDPGQHHRHAARRMPSLRRRKGSHTGWGMANRVENDKGFHVISFGCGDYNRFNVIGGEQKGKKIHPNYGGFIGYVGRSRHGRPPVFITIGVQTKKGRSFISTPASRRRRRRQFMNLFQRQIHWLHNRKRNRRKKS